MTQISNTGSNKIALISDIHYHLWQAFSNDGGMSRLLDISSVMQQLHRHCVLKNITKVGILGDVFEKRGVIDSIVYNQFTSDLKLFLQSGISVYILAGNHDQDLISNVTWDNSLQPLEKLSPLLHVYSEPTVVDLGGTKAFFCPYIHNHQDLHERLKSCGTDLAFIHAGIVGAMMLDSDYKVKEGLSLNNLQHLQIFSGHLHTPHVVGNAVYLGSPMHHRFTDSGQQKSFVVLDLDSRQWHRVPTVYPEFIHVEAKTPQDVLAISGDNYYKLRVVERVLSDQELAHLAANTRKFEIDYVWKKESETYNSRFDSELRCLRKFVTKEFQGNHLELYKKAKEYLC